MLDFRELALGLLLILGTLLLLLVLGEGAWRPTLALAGLIVTLAVAATWGWVRSPRHDAPSPLRMPVESPPDGFATSRSCRSCHPGHYASWHQSFHRTMTQKASAESVLAPFEGEVLTSRQRTYRLFQHEGEYWAEMPDLEFEAELRFGHGIDISQVEEVPTVFRPIAMTTGSHHLQTYWVPGKYGDEVRQLPWVWMIKEGRWIPTEDSFLVPPGEARHLILWNKNCIQCHSTGWTPGRDSKMRVLFSEVSEFGISCESCHAAAAEHIARHQNPVARYLSHWGSSAGDSIVNPETLSPASSVELCGQCHAFTDAKDDDEWWQHGYLRKSRPGDPLIKSRNVVHYTTEPYEDWLEAYLSEAERGMESMFWPDGTVRVGGREYHGVVLSPCYQRGEGTRRLTCLSCHSMHGYESPNDQLSPEATGNRACTQCHQEPRFNGDVSAHTHHAPGSGGSRCYNCHMPHTTYALFQAIRSHRIDSPSVQMSVEHGRPNACNLCHLDRTLAWTAGHLQDWYDLAPPKLDEEQQNIAASILWLLKGNAAQRAVVAWSFGWADAQEAAGTGWMPPFLGQLLNDPYAAVRRIAHTSLRTLPGFDEFTFDFILPTLQREDVVARVREMWDGARSAAAPAADESLLLDSSGSLDEAAFERLLQERDDTPITIGE